MAEFAHRKSLFCRRDITRTFDVALSTILVIPIATSTSGTDSVLGAIMMTLRLE